MISQKFGLQFLIPLALEKLQDDIFIEADFYYSDVLSNILAIDPSFWNDNKSHWVGLDKTINNKFEKLAELKITTKIFDNAKLQTTKGCTLTLYLQKTG